MLNWLRMYFVPSIRSAARSAREHFLEVRPNEQLRELQLLESDAEKHVFRAFYVGELPSRPMSYVVLSVGREAGNVQELRLESHPQYRKRAYK